MTATPLDNPRAVKQYLHGCKGKRWYSSRREAAVVARQMGTGVRPYPCSICSFVEDGMGGMTGKRWHVGHNGNRKLRTK